jgi:hypothetical protein
MDFFSTRHFFLKSEKQKAERRFSKRHTSIAAGSADPGIEPGPYKTQAVGSSRALYAQRSWWLLLNEIFLGSIHLGN